MTEQKNTTNLDVLHSLKEKINNNEVTAEDFENYYEQKKEEEKEFISLLEIAYQITKDKKLLSLLIRYKQNNISNLMEDIKILGWAMQENLGEDFNKMSYKLLEQIRAGKRSEVMYSVTRIFITNKQNIPDVLMEAFKPHYDIETFKCFLYTFLCSVLNSKSQEQKKEE